MINWTFQQAVELFDYGQHTWFPLVSNNSYAVDIIRAIDKIESSAVDWNTERCHSLNIDPFPAHVRNGKQKQSPERDPESSISYRQRLIRSLGVLKRILLRAKILNLSSMRKRITGGD